MERALAPAATLLVRHGQSTANAGRPTTSHSEVPLTRLGLRQAAEMAARLERKPDLMVVSPFLRARGTAEAVRRRWPDLAWRIWPIHELTYLSPEFCGRSDQIGRMLLVRRYWEQGDPAYVHGPGAESFSGFVARVRAFHVRLMALEAEVVLAVGHGQFFRAYLLALSEGLSDCSEGMRAFRSAEAADPIRNAQVVAVEARDPEGFRVRPCDHPTCRRPAIGSVNPNPA